MIKIFSNILQFGKTQILFLTAVFAVIGVSGSQLIRQTAKIHKIKKIIPPQLEGLKFSGLEGILQGQKYVGYYTDKDLKEKDALRQFSQAQYVLAPVILDTENFSHEFILFDCTNDEAALKIIRELNVAPLKKNQFGIILARKM